MDIQYRWSETVGQGIKIGLVVVGAVLNFIGGSNPDDAEEFASNENRNTLS